LQGVSTLQCKLCSLQAVSTLQCKLCSLQGVPTPWHQSCWSTYKELKISLAVLHSIVSSHRSLCLLAVRSWVSPFMGQSIHGSVHSWVSPFMGQSVSEMTYNVSMGTLNPTIPYHTIHGSVHSCVSPSWVSLIMGQSVHGSVHSWVSLFMGQSVHGSVHSWVSPFMGQSIHGSVCSWVSPFMGQSVYGSVRSLSWSWSCPYLSWSYWFQSINQSVSFY